MLRSKRRTWQSPNLEELSALVDMMREKNVQHFSWCGLYVDFKETDNKQTFEPRSIDPIENRLDSLKKTLKEIEDDEQADLMWSAAP